MHSEPSKAAIRYEQWPARQVGGQHVGSGPSGIRGVHMIDGIETGIEACCQAERSQFKNRQIVQEMIEWACTAAGYTITKEPTV